MERDDDGAFVPGLEDPAVQDLLDSPRLVLHVRRFEELLAHENKRRETFQNEAPVDQKAEFINGEIIVAEPVSAVHHEAKDRLHALLRAHLRVVHAYEAGPAGTVRGERMLVSLSRNDYEPDLCFFGKSKSHDLAPEQWALPAPDFVVEVLSPSSEARARGIKFDDYAAHGVREYWIVDPHERFVEQYVLDEAKKGTNKGTNGRAHSDRYALRAKVKHETLESVVVDGFNITAEALFDDRANLEALRKLLGE